MRVHDDVRGIKPPRAGAEGEAGEQEKLQPRGFVAAPRLPAWTEGVPGSPRVEPGFFRGQKPLDLREKKGPHRGWGEKKRWF